MPRRRPAELHVNHERWLVSYADFITLLFAFFVVMYSVSQVNESKYRVLSNTLTEAFEPARALRPIQVGDPARAPSTSAIDIRGDDRGDTAEPEIGESAAMAELTDLAQRITERFSGLVGDDLLAVHANEYWLQIELRDSILFDSGSAELSPRAENLFADMAGLLVEYDNPVQVEGHTDDQPIRNQRYPSNWELSAARASAIVKLLQSEGVGPRRLSAVGYGEHQPSASNATAEGRARNRRVTLMIAREAVERPSAALDERSSEALPLPAAPAESNASGADGSLLNPADGSSLNRADGSLLPPADGSSPNSAEGSLLPTAEGSQETAVGAENSSGSSGIEAVELEGGGLLFSSDPDLPRERP
ncbi:flagellar motor protein MotD [Marinimicrobium sp. C2-29]|uniref:flagellar motor protein MotD n=1 Tax=Marinimicrobium sp. C2-29 TaxID=3139825 RepID=UPI00313A46E2